VSRSARVAVVVSVAVLLALVVSLAGMSAASTPGASPAAPDHSVSQSPTATPRRLGEEVMSDRTATSRTYVSDGGRRVTRVFPQPVNFREGERWRAIDNTLVAADKAGFVHGRANDGDALIPRDLSEPVTVSRGAAWVRFGLRDAQGTATVAGDQASFAGVGDGVDVAYRATNSGVKETLTLAGAEAQSTFVYDIAASDGLHARTGRGGSVVFGDGEDHDRFVITPPVVWDAAKPSSVTRATNTELITTDTGWRLTVAVDRLWLRDPARVFPVTVDPNVQWIVGGTMRYSGAQRDCTLASDGLADTSLCSDPTLTVGSDASRSYKSLLYFDARSVIPQDSTIYDATLLLHAGGTGTAPSSDLRVRRVSSDWTDAATWNTRDGSAAWTTPGGDVGSATSDVGAPSPVDALNSWYYLHVPAELVQGWIWGDDPDYGLQVAADAGSPTQTYTFESTDGDPYKWPAIDLYWEEDQGDRSAYTQDTQKLTDHSQLAVNVASGNLTYTERDLTLPGSPELAVTRRWSAVGSYTPGAFARGWTDTYEGTGVRRNADDSLLFSDQTGAQYRFAPGSAAGTFVTPAGLDVSMCQIGVASGCGNDGVGGGPSYKLTDNGSGLRFYYWHPSGALGAIKDSDGNLVDLDWQTDAITISGQGRQLTYHRDLDGYTPVIGDGDHTVLYHRDVLDDDRLASVTDEDANTTHYDYNDDGYLTKITDPDGRQTRIEWEWVEDFGSWRTAKITRVLDPDDPTDPTKNPTTTYTYDTANRTTVATDPAGNATTDVTDDGQTTYTYDKHLHVTSATPGDSALPDSPTWPVDDTWDTTRPSSQPSGPWHDLAGGYVDGQGTTSVTLASTDPAAPNGTVSGVRRMALERDGSTQPVAAETTCSVTTNPPSSCPATVNQTLSIGESALTEGAHTFRQVTQDLAGHTSTSMAWTVGVDRTPPGQASAFVGYFDETTNVADIEWDPAVDQPAADGTPGSGVASYTYRWRHDSGVWSGWISTISPGTDLPSSAVGDEFDIEVQAYDAVGNLGAGVSEHIVTVATPDTSDCMAHETGGYPASCIDADMHETPMDEDDEGESVSLTGDVGPSTFGVQPMTTGPSRTGYHITVHEDSDAPYHTPLGKRWATIRNRGGKWVIGNAHQGWQFASDYEEDSVPTTGGSTRPWYRGRTINPSGVIPVTTPNSGEHSTGCGWIVNSNATPDFDPDDNAECGLGTGLNVMDLEEFTLMTNCPPRDQIPVDSHGEKVAHCTHGTMVYLTHAAEMCADVAMTPMGQTDTDCVAPIGDTLSAGTCVKWRYITSDNKWVMISDERRTNQAGRWVFIPRTSLVANARRLPNILTHGRQGNCPGSLPRG
jgi:YD repeat-containing protein